MLLVLVLACAEPAIREADTATAAATVDPLGWEVSESGPFAVGHLAWEVTYTPAAGETRTFTAHAWFPTDDTTGLPVRYDGLVDAQPTVLGDATPAEPAHADGFPVLAYSHGDQGWGATSEFLMLHAASHGWVAVAPSHTDNLLWANVDPPPPAHWVHRPADVTAAVDALADVLPDADTSAYVVAGHSRGGSTAWTVAGARLDGDPAEWCPGCTDAQLAAGAGVGDPRVVAGIGLDGTLRRDQTGATGHEGITAPMLAMSAPDRRDGHQDQFDTTDGIALTWIEVADACHQTFALGTCAALDTEEGYRIVRTYSLAFARRHLLGDTGMDGLLDGSTVLDDRATLERHD